MAVPDYLGFERQPGVLQTAIGTMGTLQQQAAQRQTMQQQAALAPVKLQQAQEAVREQPLAFGQQQKTQQMQQQSAAQQIAASKLNMEQTKHKLVDTDLADVYSAPQAQQADIYAQKRKEWIKTGIDPSEIPEQYDANMQTEAKGAYNRSSPVAAQRKEEADLYKIMLKGHFDVQQAQQKGVAAAKAAATKGTPQQQAFATAEGTANAAYFTTINKNSDSASTIYNQASKLIGTAGQIPKDLGLLRGGKVYLTNKGRELLSNTKQMQLALFSAMPHVGKAGNMMLGLIKGSKPGASMPYQTFVNVAKWYKTASSLAMEKNQMAQVLKQNGITDRNQINNIWDRFQDAYPVSDAQGNVIEENTKKWPQFLQNNPGLISGAAGGVVNAPPPPSIAGKKLPGTVGSLAGTQTVPQPKQAPPQAQQGGSIATSPYAQGGYS
jgi:hypothetical protein